jgi:hypothetical protein
MIQGVDSGSYSGQGVMLLSVVTQGATRCDLEGQSMSMDHEKEKKKRKNGEAGKDGVYLNTVLAYMCTLLSFAGKHLFVLFQGADVIRGRRG